MEAATQNTLSGEALKDVGSTAEDSKGLTGAAAVEAMAETKHPEKIAPETQQAALDWMISNEPAGGTDGNLHTVSINVGTDDEPNRIDWVLRPIEDKALRLIRKRANNTKEAKQTGVTDEFRVNLEIVAVCTVSPNLVEAATQIPGSNGDPIEALRIRFANRPGFITQLSGKVLSASGFDEDDVQDKAQVAAAGN